jgi:hypothetical protein
MINDLDLYGDRKYGTLPPPSAFTLIFVRHLKWPEMRPTRIWNPWSNEAFRLESTTLFPRYVCKFAGTNKSYFYTGDCIQLGAYATNIHLREAKAQQPSVSSLLGGGAKMKLERVERSGHWTRNNYLSDRTSLVGHA